MHFDVLKGRGSSWTLQLRRSNSGRQRQERSGESFVSGRQFHHKFTREKGNLFRTFVIVTAGFHRVSGQFVKTTRRGYTDDLSFKKREVGFSGVPHLTICFDRKK
ncbi:hypothetical protein NPIL_319381 [Nephila pilipes]|uniref:Uncharacterized protein n=1 Tax=Nephila pilipes TaxID=299642 RepID=A0A8X6N2P1_NEPPI|nr:hypothetical protein NPIL_319381 [Nephila pilipes]